MTLVAARELSVPDFVSFALFANFALFAAAFALPGLDAEIVRTHGQAVSRILTMKTVAASGGGIVLILIGTQGLHYGLALVLMALFSGMSQGMAETPESLLVTGGQFKLRALTQALPSVLALLTVALLAHIGLLGLTSTLVVVACRDACRLLLATILSRVTKSLRAYSVLDPGTETKRLWPLAVITVFGYVYYRVDVLILGALAADRQVALYAAAFLIITALQNIPSALGPIILRVVASQRDLGARIAKTQFLLGLVFCGLTLFAADVFTPLILGREFEDAAALVRVLSASLPFLFLNSALLRMSMAIQTMDFAIVVTLAYVTACSVVANVLLVLAAGALGAAIASVLIEISLTIGLFLLARRAYSMDKDANSL